MRRRVLVDLAERRRAPGAALVEHDDAVMPGIEEAPMGRRRAGARPPMQEENRHAVWIARLLPVEGMNGVDRQTAGLVGLDLGEQFAAGHRDWRPPCAAWLRRIYCMPRPAGLA